MRTTKRRINGALYEFGRLETLKNGSNHIYKVWKIERDFREFRGTYFAKTLGEAIEDFTAFDTRVGEFYQRQIFGDAE